jgi:hypothetical protein
MLSGSAEVIGARVRCMEVLRFKCAPEDPDPLKLSDAAELPPPQRADGPEDADRFHNVIPFIDPAPKNESHTS